MDIKEKLAVVFLLIRKIKKQKEKQNSLKEVGSKNFS